jgi:superoxide dismutase, Cu-Zn family
MKHPIGTTRYLAMVGLAMMASALALPALAQDLTVTMRKATQQGVAEALGTITISNTDAGASFKLALHGLPPGPHGFHVHENANCDPTLLNGVRIPAGAAGGHFDPDNTYKHEGPTGDGHLGDLPVLVAAADGTATQTLAAPRIKNIGVLKDHALVIQIGSDNYSDIPVRDGGGGGRFACGLVE